MFLALAAWCSSGALGAGFSTPAQTFAMGDHTVRYHGMGEVSDPPAILLGGGPGFSSWNLEPVQRHLARLGFHAGVMDMLGVGENAAEIDASPLNVWIQQVERLRREMVGEKRVTLIGHSWGALMALVYTREYPDHVDRLVLINPVDPERKALRDVVVQIDARRSRQSSEPWDGESAWVQAPESARSAEEHARHQIERALPSYFLDYAQGQRYAEQFDARDFNTEMNIEGWRAYRRNPVEYATIRKWDLPISFLGCRQDLLMPVNLEQMQAELTFEHVTVLDGCVHFPWEEVPAAFDAAIGAHLGHGSDQE